MKLWFPIFDWANKIIAESGYPAIFQDETIVLNRDINGDIDVEVPLQSYTFLRYKCPDPYPFKVQQTITYPVQLEENDPISFFTIVGLRVQPDEEPTKNLPLRAPMFSLEAPQCDRINLCNVDFTGFPIDALEVSFTGAMVICGL